MTNPSWKILQKISNETVIQGNHRRRIIEFYKTLVEAAREEFSEDNIPTLNAFLRECHEEALNEV